MDISQCYKQTINDRYFIELHAHLTEILKVDATNISYLILNYCYQPYLELTEAKNNYSKKRVLSMIHLKSGLLAFATLKGGLYVCDAINQETIHRFKAGKLHPSGIYEKITTICELNNDVIACASYNNSHLAIIDLNNDSRKFPLEDLKVKGIMCLKFFEPNILIIGSTRGSVMILNIDTATCTKLLEYMTTIFDCLLLNNQIIIGKRTNSIKIHNLLNEKIDEIVISDTYYVRTIIHFPHKNLIAVAGCNHSRGSSNEAGDYIGIYDLDTLQCVNKITYIKGTINKIVFILDNFIAITAHCKIMIINYITGKCIQELEYNDNTGSSHNDILGLTLLNNNKLAAATIKGIIVFDINLKNL